MIIVFLSLLFIVNDQVTASLMDGSKRECSLYPTNLRCEYLRNPVGIEMANPRLSWNLLSNQRNQIQFAYQIIVSSSEENINNDFGDLWDTHKVDSEQNLHVSYAGKKLKSRNKVFWKVRVWDQYGNASNWSKAAKWEMGFLSQKEWRAKWVGECEDMNPDALKTDPAPYFRKEFNLKHSIKSARAYVCGLGYYELSLNGKRVSDYVLTPSQTNYDRRNLRNLLYYYDDQSTTRVFYNIFDVTDDLIPDQNTIGIILGNGWYNQRDRIAEGWMWYDTPRFILQLEVEYGNEQREIIISDDTWKVTTGPIIYNGIFTGEHYDARLEIDGWNKNGFEDSKWKTARLVRAPTGKLEAQLAPADKVIDTIHPIYMTNPAQDVYVFDLGQMISGWVKIKVRGWTGDKIVLRFIEEMGKDYGQKDIFILKGDGTEEFEPHFTWHAFRKVEVSGVRKPMNLGDIEGKIVNTAVDTVGFFECSNDLFNKIYDNYIRTQLGNFHGNISSDCPHRERLGYTGDGQILVESTIFNFNMTQFYRKWINDMHDARNKVTGYVPHTAPFEGGGGGPAWGSAYVTVLWFYYVYYGDRNILKQHYSGMKQWVEYLNTRTNREGIIVREEPKGWCLGDWATPDKIEIPPPLVNTCYFYYVLKIMTRVAEICQHAEDIPYFTNLAEKTKVSLNIKYFDVIEGKYWTSRQGADVFPLAFGMVPENKIMDVLESMIQNILKNKGHLDTGILATPLMLEVLTDHGREDIAFTIMNQRDFPSYGDYILGKGATTLWEYWDGKLSHSHPMFGSVIRWFYKGVAGINPDTHAPGFKNIIIKPHICGDLTFTKASIITLYGKVMSSWRLAEKDFLLDLDVPVNTTATVYIPAIDSRLVFENGLKPDESNGIDFIKMQNEWAIYRIGSGHYEFFSKNVNELLKEVHTATPIILPKDSIFFKPQAASIRIESAIEEADIYYTVDGSKPNKRSHQFTGPFQVYDNVLIKARAYKKGYIPSFIKSENICFVDPKINGIKYTVYEGHWDERPDLEKLIPVSSGHSFQFNVSDIKKREDYIAVIFEGIIEISDDGEYIFYSSANDGSLLYVDNKVVVDNAGYFGEKFDHGSIELKKGRHLIKVLYFENTGTESIDVLIEGPGLEKQPIPPNKLFYNK